jgi:DivIVA domain-containing protein
MTGEPSVEHASTLRTDDGLGDETRTGRLSDRVRTAMFRQSWKGYDTAEVDDFLDEVASTADDLESRLREAEARLHLAIDRVTAQDHRVARSDGDDAIRRTLVLAQRAADLVVSEARSVADRIVADARERGASVTDQGRKEAESVVATAHQTARGITEQAEASAERRAAQRAAEIQAELAHVVEEQGRRQRELESINAEIAQARLRQRQFLEEQLRGLGDQD